MTITEKRIEQGQKCREFFLKLISALVETHELLPSCNNDASLYLCPKGTCDEVTYYGKPEGSFRVSDHWNWYSSTKRCNDPKYIQCLNRDLPKAHKREKEGLATKPIMADCVAIFKDGKYHTVYGEFYDPQNRKWC